MKKYIYPANILLPCLVGDSGTRWAVVACDQYTSEKEYWETADSFVGDAPSALRLMLPEAYLDREEEEIPKINASMREYLDGGVLKAYENSMIYLEREQSDGKIRRGLVCAIDLEDYDYKKGSVTVTRATEGTVLERIPPRVAIRRGAEIEMPHIMILIDDPEKTVIEPLAKNAGGYRVAYDFDLMAKSGHAKGYFVDESDFDGINDALGTLCADGVMQKKYGVDAAPLLFAIGDGNHSLASAKALYEEIKAEIGEAAALEHPARFALCEIVNLHDEALEFEPIYRVVFGVDAEKFIGELEKYVDSLDGGAERQELELVWCAGEKKIAVENPISQLAVGTVQAFLDEYVKTHEGVSVDYIHGIDSTKALARRDGAVGILFDGMGKGELFKTVICDGALPRKTFSMGHAADKRFYIECRKIR
ncbi:MAG: DUF1015 domain-containing protein [Ruminococcaceae bacterium]|nr:DUF1015 domain-containing protein [Oscillospiraceae bacterium]